MSELSAASEIHSHYGIIGARMIIDKQECPGKRASRGCSDNAPLINAICRRYKFDYTHHRGRYPISELKFEESSRARLTKMDQPQRTAEVCYINQGT